MPIVPVFQGGVPQVGDSAASGGMVIQAPRARMDYGRVMQEAVKPLDDFAARNYEFAMRERSREVKAESDDAEVQVMQAIQRRLYAPETGYMNLQGKNAAQGYDSTFQGMKKDVDDIVGRLSPQAREAVQSRITDRLMNAQGQMMRWNSQQTRAWQVSSSQGRLDALVDDAAQHYGDENYRAKSWLSAVDELEYQAQLAGMDESVTAQKKAALYDLFQAKRFEAWAQDDPVSAFQAAQGEKSFMGGDVWGKMDEGLWRQAKPQLALAAAGTLPRNMSKNDLIQAIRGNGVKTGIPAVDNLEPVRKSEILTTAYAFVEHDVAQTRAKVELDTKSSIATIRDTGDDPNMIPKDAFIAADPNKGEQKYEAYQNEAATAHWIYSLDKMPNAAAEASIAAAQPIPGDPNYAEKSKNWKAMQRAYAQVQKARAEDPVAAAVASGAYGLRAIEDWSSPDSLAELTRRSDLSGRIAEDYGHAPVMLSKSEAEGLTQYLGTLAPADHGRLLGTISARLPEGQVLELSRQLGDTSSQALLLAKDSSMPMGTAATYLQGMQAMKEKQASVNTLTTDPILGKPTQYGRLDGYYEDPVVRDKVMNAVTGVAAGRLVSGEADNVKEAYEQAFEQVLGEEINHNGRKIYLKGASEFDLWRTINAIGKPLRDKEQPYARTPSGVAFSGDAYARLLLSAPLVPAPEGANAFNVVFNNQFLEDMKGRRIVIKVEGRP